MEHKVRANFTIKTRLIAIFIFTSVIVFGVNMYMYSNINQNITVIDNVYVSNVSLNELTDTLSNVQENMYEYLNTKSSDTLESYYRNEEYFKSLITDLNDLTSDNNMKLMEKNIKSMSVEYLEITDEAVQAKRGRNTQRYKEIYEEATIIYQYINNYIYNLNNEQFKNNSNTYELLLVSLRYLEIISTVVLVVISILNVILIAVITSSITNPLSKLAKAANEVARGNFDVSLLEIEYDDEVGVVAKAFNKMIVSIKEYIVKVKQSIEFEGKAKEKELIMESHLKDAQLKYLQAQINPHFLFNTLNAGDQLAMMEGAEKTSIFIEKMADFFRYNIKRINEDANLGEELELVENYLYIMNVRFAGDIHFEKYVDENILDARIPSMVLQPIVENAVNYGIRDIDWQGKISLTIEKEEKNIKISIRDNGKGMTKERIEKVMLGEIKKGDLTKNSNGIGLGNVINRLKLYFGDTSRFEIRSEGIDLGTEVLIYMPICKEKDNPEEV